MKDLDMEIKQMKNNKCRDPDGLINQLFKPGVAGVDINDSTMTMMNKIKDNLEIPKHMQNVTIALIPNLARRINMILTIIEAPL